MCSCVHVLVVYAICVLVCDVCICVLGYLCISYCTAYVYYRFVLFVCRCASFFCDLTSEKIM